MFEFRKVALLTFSWLLLLPFFLSASVSEVKTYDQLVSAIRQTRRVAQERIEKAARKEKVREAWETGKLIDEHILQYKERADYGKQVMLRLSKDLGISGTELHYMVEFARTYPNFRSTGNLPWGHYQALLSLNEAEERKEVEEKAEKENWTQDQIRSEIRQRKAAKRERDSKSKVKLISVKLGKVGTYKIVRASTGPLRGKLVFDLGFSNYFEIKTSDFVTTGDDLDLHENDVVQISSSDQNKKRISKASAEDLYTYQAYLSRVIDGDTFEVVIDLGFGVWTTQKLRLRGLDAPEILTKEGKEAKAFVENFFGLSNQRFTTTFTPKHPNIPLLICTHKSDKYDRYLADLFFNGQSLNEALISKRLAAPVSE